MGPTSDRGRRSPRRWTDGWLALQALAWLGVMRAVVGCVPFRATVWALGLAHGETSATLDPALEKEAVRVGWAVRAAAARAPWVSTCLAQGLAAMAMLRRRGIDATLYLAVAQGVRPAQTFAAHAWLRCGAAVLTGADERHRFTVISTFSVARAPVPTRPSTTSPVG